MSQQLVKKGANGRIVNVNPKSWIEAIKDKNTGQPLVEILQGFNMYFLPYNGNTSATRCLVPTMLRKKGLWITYVKYDGNVYTEWYATDELDDKSWGDSSNWRIGNNTLVGDITISANGNWVINGTETEFKAVGEKGNTPLLRVANNRLQVSYDLGDTYIDVTNNPVYTKFRWLATTGDTQANNVGRIQASTDEGKTWTNMSNDFTNNLHIKKYIGVNESLPTSGIAEGTIYAKGPYYAEDDTLNDNPIYRLWVYAWKGNTLAWQDNGEFQSIAAGIVQETGNSETEVMSQKATTEKLTELASQVIYDVSANNDGATFPSLSALLSSENLSTLIPIAVRCGGMSIRFAQTSDNKYVQYRLMAQSFSTTVTDWQGVDDEPTAGSKNLVKSGGVWEELNSENNDYEDITPYNQGIPPIGGINADGSRAGSTNFYNYQFKPNGSTMVVAHVGSNKNTSMLAIAFYSEVNTTANLDSSKFISGVTFNNTNIQEDYIAEIPSNCKMVVVSNRKELFDSYSVDFYININEKVNAIKNNTDAIDARVTDIENNIDYKPTAKSTNLVESGGVWEEFNSENNGYEDITSYNQGVPPIGSINLDGSRGGSSDFYNYKYKPNGSTFIIAHVGSNKNTNKLAIAFYSEVESYGGSLDSTKFISGVAFNNIDAQEYYEAEIPSNCKMVVVSNKHVSFSNYSVKFYTGIKPRITDLESNVDFLLSNGKDWKKTIWWIPNCTWNTNTQTGARRDTRITSSDLFEVASPCRVVFDSDIVNVDILQYSASGVYETQLGSTELVVGKKYRFVAYNKALDTAGVSAPFLYPEDNPVWNQFSIVDNVYADYKEIDMKNDIPSYFNSQITTALSTASEKLRNAGKNKSAIIFTTDSHWGANEKHSVPIIKLLKEKLNVSIVVNGGDIITDVYPDKSDALNELADFQNRNKETMPLFVTIGNHDKNGSNQQVPAALLNNNEIYYYINAQSERQDAKYGEYFAHYTDNVAEKTRYFFLSSGLMTMPDSDYNFLISALNGLESGWSAVIIQHLWYNIVDETEYLPEIITNLMQLMDDYNARNSGSFGNITYDFTSAVGKIQYGLGGHLHYDKSFSTTGGIPILLCDCDKCRRDAYKGTVDEQCVTVVIADYDAEKLYGVRIGRGSDIEISY